MRVMKPYSEDLRTRTVQAVRGGTSKSAAARLFSVSLSTVKRYMRLADWEASLAPKKGGQSTENQPDYLQASRRGYTRATCGDRSPQAAVP
jgi:transposase